ncbi:YqcC family protein [Oceanospirillum sediminis]|uniref:YqcC family protein n=1 Tax=Oceanospirillum sediminis TaxID=2760088 RepID=A0A839IL95_9GAMM|nr:YqcC family protein [Oceanospirillum sediminis]
MSSQYRLSQLLDELEETMMASGLWQQPQPDAEAFLSTVPFCIDSMNFLQWLRYVFVARMRAILDAGAEIPSQVSISPLAEEYFRTAALDGKRVTELLRDIEQAMSGAS